MASMLEDKLLKFRIVWSKVNNEWRKDLLQAKSTYPQYIIHQRPFPWTDLNQLHTAARATLDHPFRNSPYPNEFAKYLCDLRRSHEITFLPKDFGATLAAGSGVVSGIGIR
jgi:hypothetical protein